jgi:cobalt/nickel transport system permease protein
VHIPDGYLSPQTCAAGFAVAVPTWVAASRRVTKVVKTRNVPLLAVLASVSFLIMMFNVPIPDGTTAHAVGGTLIAICLGRWAATIAVSVALLFQALLFGDGGVLAYGVNVTNMAIILPFVGFAVYRLIAGKTPLTSTRRVVAAAIGGYVGICTAALAAGIELGIQPDLFKSANGTPLYSPYHLSQAIPAMLLAHLLVAGVVEAVLTGGVVAYLQRADITRLIPNHPGIPLTTADVVVRPRRLSPAKVAVGFIATMVVLTPLGLLAPGGAFGEDAPQDLNLHKYGLNAIPSGLEKYNGFWSHSILGGYGFHNGDHPDIGYVLSAVVGIAVIGLAIFLIGRVVQSVARRNGTLDLTDDTQESVHA